MLKQYLTLLKHSKTVVNSAWQPALSWRASGDRQISLSASDERAFANFRVKNVVFTGTHFCAVLSMVEERAFANFCGKNIVFLQIHIFVLSPVGDSASWLSWVQQGVTESTDAAEVLSLLLAEYRLEGGAHTQKTKVRGLIKYIQSSKSGWYNRGQVSEFMLAFSRC